MASTTIKLKRNATAGIVPAVAALADGEIALNTADGKLFFKGADSTIKSLAQDFEKTVALANTNAIDLSKGRVFTATPSGAKAYTITKVPAAPNATCFIMDIRNGAASTITWFPNIQWPKGAAPTLTAGRDLIGFITNDGVNWVGLLLGEEIANAA